METLIINAHFTYPGWSEGKLNLTFMNLAKAFFLKHGNQVVETFIERGYDPEEEVKKHAAADLVILQTPVNWFSAPWIYKKYVDEVFNVGLTQKVLLEGDGRTRKDPGRQYGMGGKMHGKKFMISATWNVVDTARDEWMKLDHPFGLGIGAQLGARDGRQKRQVSGTAKAFAGFDGDNVDGALREDVEGQDNLRVGTRVAALL
jgi:putative NADPH-quinone reductase